MQHKNRNIRTNYINAIIDKKQQNRLCRRCTDRQNSQSHKQLQQISIKIVQGLTRLFGGG